MSMLWYPDGYPAIMPAPHPEYNSGIRAKISLLTRARHKIRSFFWAPSTREIWLLRGDVHRLNERCKRLEAEIRELNPGILL
jgi:hypothetical protein